MREATAASLRLSAKKKGDSEESAIGDLDVLSDRLVNEINLLGEEAKKSSDSRVIFSLHLRRLRPIKTDKSQQVDRRRGQKTPNLLKIVVSAYFEDFWLSFLRR